MRLYGLAVAIATQTGYPTVSGCELAVRVEGLAVPRALFPFQTRVGGDVFWMREGERTWRDNTMREKREEREGGRGREREGGRESKDLERQSARHVPPV